jgi:hypothetical protein
MEGISPLIQSLQHNPIISLFFLTAYLVSGKLTDSQPGHETKPMAFNTPAVFTL